MMVIDKSTQMVLRKFAEVNDNIFIPQGNIITTRSQDSNVFLARAKVKDEFEGDMPIYNLPEFNAVMGMFEEPALKFADGYVLITEREGAGHMQKYKFANKDMLDLPSGFPSPRDPEFTFQITQDDLKRIEKACAVNKMDKVLLVKKGSHFSIEVMTVDKESGKQVSDNVYYARREEVDSGDEFRCILAKTFFTPILQMDYTVEIHATSALHYIYLYNDWLEYWLAMSYGSTYTKSED